MADESSTQTSLEGDSDVISVKNLQLPSGVIAPNVWGQSKPQPAQVSITLGLSAGLNSAASQDGLDENTIHYGELSKRIRSRCQKEQTLDTLSSAIAEIVSQMGLRADGTTRLSWSVIRVTLPKASMYGTAVEVVDILDYGKDGKSVVSERIFGLRDMKLMTLIGVNEYERTAKQPLVADLDLFLKAEPKENGDVYPSAFFSIEQKLGEIILPTAFETLEALANFTVDHLKEEVNRKALPCRQLKLRLEKPRAIAWADAPSVEVLRMIAGERSGGDGGGGALPLKVIKPYLQSSST